MSLLHLPIEVAWLVGGALLLAATLGFFSGRLSARIQERRAKHRARTGLRRLYESVLGSLDTAGEVCQLLDGYDTRCLSPAETEHLDKRRTALVGLLTRIINRQRGVVDAVEPGEVSRPAEPLAVRWEASTVHPVSGLPDRDAFDENLKLLVEAGHAANRCSHVLLVRIDKLSSLVGRCGQAATQSLLRKLANVVCRTIRDDDLCCQIGFDQLAVLLVGADSETGRRIAESVRDAVRSHRFRIDEIGPEILLTASFGLTVCLPDDRPDLVLDRAAYALDTSQRHGRNQLHVHDGVGVTCCALSA